MKRSTLISAAIIVAALGLGGAATYGLAGALVPYKKDAPPSLEYVPSADVLEFTSFGFQNTLADILWIRSIQYFNEETRKPRDPTRKKAPLLAPMGEAITELDPDFHGAYWYIQLFLRIVRRYEEALDLLDKGRKRHPDVSFYASEMAQTCLFDLRDDPFPETRKRPGIDSWRDLGLHHLKEAVSIPGHPPILDPLLQQLLRGRNETRLTLEIFANNHRNAKTRKERAYWAGRIKETLGLWFADLVRDAVEAFRREKGSLPSLAEIPRLPALARAGFGGGGVVGDYFFLRTPAFDAGPVEGFRDAVLIDLPGSRFLSLHRVRNRDAEIRDTLRRALESYRLRFGEGPGPGAEGIRRLVEAGLLSRIPLHPLGGGYRIGPDGDIRTEKGWNEAFRAPGLLGVDEE